MKKSCYLLSSGELKRRDNTILFISDEEKEYLPVEVISDLFIFGEVKLNKRLLEFLTKQKVVVHFFNYYEYYVGSYYPREYLNSGLIILKQAEAFLDDESRLYLAKKFVYGAISNMLFILRTYASRNRDLEDVIEELLMLQGNIEAQNDITSLMALEGVVSRILCKSFLVSPGEEVFYFFS